MKPLVVGLLAIAVVCGTTARAQPPPPKGPHSHFNGCCNLGPSTCDRTTPADCAQQGGQFQPLEVCDFATGSCTPLHAAHKSHAEHMAPARPGHPVLVGLHHKEPGETAPTATPTRTPTPNGPNVVQQVDQFLGRIRQAAGDENADVADAVAALPPGCKVVVTMSGASAQPACTHSNNGCCDLFNANNRFPACNGAPQISCARQGGDWREGQVCDGETGGCEPPDTPENGIQMPRVILFCGDQQRFIPSFTLCPTSRFFQVQGFSFDVYHVEIGIEQSIPQQVGPPPLGAPFLWQLPFNGGLALPLVLGDIDTQFIRDTQFMQAITALDVISKDGPGPGDNGVNGDHGTKGCARAGACHSNAFVRDNLNNLITVPGGPAAAPIVLHFPQLVVQGDIIDSTEDAGPLSANAGAGPGQPRRQSLRSVCDGIAHYLGGLDRGPSPQELKALELCYFLREYKAKVPRSRQ